MTQVERVRAKCAQEGVEALLVTGAVNRRYISGFTGSAGWVLVTRDGAYLLVDARYVQQGKVQAPQFKLVECEDFKESLARLLGELGILRVGFESAHTSVNEHNGRSLAAPDIEWVPTLAWIEEMRAVKDTLELKRIEAAVQLADEAFSYILDRIKGRTELEVALDLEFFMRRSGAEGVAFRSIVASGPRGALPHAVPTSAEIREGTFVTLDFGAVVDGYCSDMTRTVGVGSMDEKQREVYGVVKAAQEAGLQAVRPGRLGKEVDADARRVIEAAGYGAFFGHGLGHGLGMDVHEEPPRLSKRGEARLLPGMVTSVEPGVYIPDWGGIRIEDLVVVTEDGCRVLTRSTKELVEL